MPRRLPGLALAALLVAAAPAAAWNGVGHLMVAKVAYDGLGDAERHKAHELLKQHPHYTSYLIKNRPTGAAEDEWAFLRAAAWPDHIRGPLPPEKPDPAVIRYHRPGDHYVNVPIFPKGVSEEFCARVRARPGQHDVVSALQQRVAELTLRTAAADDKAVALAWLMHLTGDIHQPLHCGTLYTEDLFPTGDAGGNGTGVRVNGVPVRLHTYWDGLLGKALDLPAEVKDTPEYTELAYKVACLGAARLAKDHPRDTLEEVKKADFKDWMAESSELAVRVAYWDGEIARVAVKVPPGFNAPIPEGAKEVPDGYATRAAEVARRRAALAGYRMADLLRHYLPKD
jgi:S1/P1 Nuclease